MFQIVTQKMNVYIVKNRNRFIIYNFITILTAYFSKKNTKMNWI